MEAFFAQCKKTPDSWTILSITPREAQRGATKMVWIKRMVVDESGCQRQKELEVPVTVPAGCQNKQRITLQRLSNEEPGKVPGDYTFVIKVNATCEQPVSGKGSVSMNMAVHQRTPEQPSDLFNPGNSLSRNMALHTHDEGTQASAACAGPLSRGNAPSRNRAQHQSTAELHGPPACVGTNAFVQVVGSMNDAGRCALDSGTPYAAAGQSSPYGHGVAVLDGATNHGSTHAPIQSACDEAAWNSAF